MRFLLLLALLLAGTVHAAPCLDYQQVAIQGTLVSKAFPGPPNYESVAAGDREEVYYFVVLVSPACVSKGSDKSNLEPAVDRIEKIQLMFPWQSAQASYDKLKSSLNKRVSCTGVLLGRHTGHHHSAVMLTEAVCHAT